MMPDDSNLPDSILFLVNKEFLDRSIDEPVNSEEIRKNISRRIQEFSVPRKVFWLLFVGVGFLALVTLISGTHLAINGLSYTISSINDQRLLEMLNGIGRIMLGAFVLGLAIFFIKIDFDMMLMELHPDVALDYYYKRLIDSPRLMTGVVTAVTATQQYGTTVYFRVQKGTQLTDHKFITMAEKPINPGDSVVVINVNEFYVLL